MTSNEHQRFVNVLARGLKQYYPDIMITGIDVRGTPDVFDVEYRDLRPPKPHNGRVPDLVGMRNGVKHIGEAETNMSGGNLDAQLRAFSNRATDDPGTPVLLHVIVPEPITKQMQEHINNLKLAGQLGYDQLPLVWPMPSNR